MSATLRPFDVTADVLGLDDPSRMAFELAFPPANRRTYAVDTPPLFASRREDPSVQRTVTAVLEDAIAISPGNVLVYFPSYAEAARYADLVDLDGPLFLDEAGTRAEGLRSEFADGAAGALFTSLWGTLTEGVSFDGDDARTAVVVGVPYPYLDDRLEAVQAAYADAFDAGDDLGWAYAVEIPTVRKTRQALGRVLRAPGEVGARILVDRRYTAADMGEYGVRERFPPEERAELVDVQPTKLRYALFNFFDEHDAWDGPRPTP
jgi:DNA excision repair protein ERCC-2